MTSAPIIPIPGFSEPFSSLSHLVGAGVFCALGIWLIIRGRGHAGRVLALVIFSVSVVFLLAMSGVFHLLQPGGAARNVLQRLDHAGIFFLIAGTFTPIHGILFQRGWRWGILVLVWTIAITGITLKTIFFHDIAEWLGLGLYLGLGWLGAVTGILLYRRHSFGCIKPLLYGALAYTAGAIMEFIQMPTLVRGVIGPHEVFHIAVLVGISFHFALVVRITQRDRRPRLQ
ncbi:MAG: hemolysin III family protein [Gammaproteobacteria bacterium]|nr:hemolysin III family protein [Gammaproteobacteria bacterium]